MTELKEWIIIMFIFTVMFIIIITNDHSVCRPSTMYLISILTTLIIIIIIIIIFIRIASSWICSQVPFSLALVYVTLRVR